MLLSRSAFPVNPGDIATKEFAMLTIGDSACRRQKKPGLVALGICLLLATAAVLGYAPSPIVAVPMAVVGLVCCELGLP